MIPANRRPGWKYWQVADLIREGVIEIGDGYRAKNSEMGTSGLPFARAGNVNNGFHFEDTDILGEASVRLAGEKLSCPGDITFTSKGTFGRFALVRTDTPPFVYSPQLCYWRVKRDSLVDRRFLYYWMQGSDCMNQLNEVKGLTDMADYVSLTNQRKMWLSVPPIPAQRQIAGILSAYDNLIENNQRRIKILEEMARSLYREWFIHFRFPGHDKVKMVSSSLGPIPQGWEVSTIQQVGQVITGKTPSKANSEYYGEDMPFVKTPDMHGNMFILETGERLSKAGANSQASKTIPAGSICVSCIGTIGVVSLTTVDCQTNQQINSVILAKEITREYLFFRLQDLKQKLENLGSTGATMGNVNKSKFEGMEISGPPDDLLERYHRLVGPQFSEILILLRNIQNLRRTRDLLLPRLLSGMIAA